MTKVRFAKFLLANFRQLDDHTSFYRGHRNSKTPKRIWVESSSLKVEGQFSVFLSQNGQKFKTLQLNQNRPYTLDIFNTTSSHALLTSLEILDCLAVPFLSYRIFAWHEEVHPCSRLQCCLFSVLDNPMFSVFIFILC